MLPTTDVISGSCVSSACVGKDGDDDDGSEDEDAVVGAAGSCVEATAPSEVSAEVAALSSSEPGRGGGKVDGMLMASASVAVEAVADSSPGGVGHGAVFSSVVFLLSASLRIFRTFSISPIPRVAASRARFSAASACSEEDCFEVAEGMSGVTGSPITVSG